MGSIAHRLLAALVLASACGVEARVPDKTLLDLAGNSEYQKLAGTLEAHGLKSLQTTAEVHALCFAYARLKRYRKLTDCLDELAVRASKGDTETLLFGLDDVTPDLHLMRAAAHIDLGRFSEGTFEAAKALEWARTSAGDDRDQEIEALVFLVIAGTHAGDRTEAARWLAELERVRASGGVLGKRDFTTVKSIALGRAYMALGRHVDAIKAIQGDRSFQFKAAVDNMLSGASLSRRNAWRWQELPRLFILSHALLRAGHLADAKASYDRLLSIPETRHNGEIYWNALFDRGSIAEREGDLPAAIEFYRRAIDAIEEQRSSITHETSKIGFLRDKQLPFDRTIRLLFESRRDGEVFDYIERAKSRAMLDMLAGKVTFTETRLAADGPVHVRDASSWDRLQIQVSKIRNAAIPGGAFAGAAALPDSIDPETDFAVLTVPSAELAGALEPDEAIVQFYMGSDYLAVSVLTREGRVAVRRPLETLPEEVLAFRKLSGALGATSERLSAAARQLYGRLIEPVEAALRDKRLTLVPHGSLHYLPFAALEKGDTGRVLIEDHAIRVLPSASLVNLLKSASPAASAESLLVVGNPTGDLPGAETEAKAIAAIFPKAQLMIGATATRDAFIRSASRHGRIHIAAHAKFFADQPLESAILFSPSRADKGMLTVRDLYRMRFNAELVVLSACDTGVSHIHNGDELVGLIRGFLYGGARSIVATLWEIEDQSAAQFSQHFYRNLASMDKSNALREAVLAVKAKHPHPIFWAPFVLTGGN